ncbi:MAG: 4Fe-4S binding protein [Desulfobacteraceae bacterium]|nr:4Fe-4S binding protein [Desulfobacteraceae bacterium]
MAFRNRTYISSYGRRYRRGGGPGGGRGHWGNIPDNSMPFDQANQPLQELPQYMSKGQTIESLKQRFEILKKQLDTILMRINELSDEKGRMTKTQANLKAFINENKCTGCRNCMEVCPYGAIIIHGKASVDSSTCTGCGLCISQCPRNAITLKPVPYISSPVLISQDR